MKFNLSKHIRQAIGLGIIAGSRSMLAPAVASHILSRNQLAGLKNSGISFMQSEKTALVLKVLAAAELVGDKLPNAPNRIAPSAISARFISGALCGAGIYKAMGGKSYLGAILGGSAAVLSTVGGFYLRRATVKATKIADPVIGGIEDALVTGAGVALIKDV